MIGLLNVYKPPGPTSHDLVAQVRRRVGRGARVGHCGTLDPFAEGVLVLAVGAATRLARYVQAQPKRYRAEITLGATSRTDDPQGPITPAPQAAAPAEPAVRRVVGTFVGEIQQVPPAHSAVHVDGQRAYKLARRGRELALPARAVVVHSIEIVRYAWPALELDVRCGGGTYVRALARDLGAALGVGGYCSRLLRTEVGAFRAQDAVPPDLLDPARHLLPPLAALGALARVVVDGPSAGRLVTGRTVGLDQATPGAASGEVAAVSRTGELVAVCRAEGDGRLLRPIIVLADRAGRNTTASGRPCPDAPP